MTDCPNGELRDLLPDLLHHGLAPAQRATVEAHVARCAECRAELALLGAARDSMRPTAVVDASAIVGALPTYQAAGGGRWSSWRAFAAAAVAAIAIGGTFLAVVAGDTGPKRTPSVATAPGRDTVDRQQPAHPAPAAQVAAHGSGLATRRGAPGAPPELAMEHGLGDLTDTELSALLDDIGSLDALPVVDVEGTPLVPGGALPSVGGGSR